VEQRGCGIKYDLVSDRHRDDERYERELEAKAKKDKAEAAAVAAKVR
jgi:hypothetical protein